jgi:hypothetical protein
MGRRSRERRQQAQKKQESLKEYSVQATPYMIRDLGWKFLNALAEACYPSFTPKDFRPLVFGPRGVEGVDPHRDPSGERGEAVRVFIACLKDITDCPDDRAVMIVPYLDKEGIRVLYFKWVEETLEDSFTASDGQNRVWKDKE